MATVAQILSEFVDGAARVHHRARDLQAAAQDAPGSELRERLQELAELSEMMDAQRAMLTSLVRSAPD